MVFVRTIIVVLAIPRFLKKLSWPLVRLLSRFSISKKFLFEIKKSNQ